MTINRLNQGTTNQVLVKAISGQTTNLLELQDSSGNVVSSIGPTGVLGGTVSQPQGLVHIETRTVTASSAESFNNVFSSTYDNYRIIANYKGGATGSLAFRYRASGSDDSSAQYNRQIFVADNTSLTGNRTTGNTSMVDFANQGTNHNNNFSLDLFGPYVANATHFNCINFFSGTAGPVLRITSGTFNLTTVFDGITFIPASSTISGTISIYGYRKS